MKVLFVTLGILLIALTGNAQGVPGRDEFNKLAFEVNLEKERYVLSEPITVTFRIINKTSRAISIFSPAFPQECELEVNLQGKNQVFRYLSNISGKPVRFPRSLSPKQQISDEVTFTTPFTGAFFSVPGRYSVRFRMISVNGEQAIASNTVAVRIEAPRELDKKAFEFLTRHSEYFGLSTWVFSDAAGAALLEQFVSDFGESVYGEHAISALAYTFLYAGRPDKAKTEFEKLTSSKNKEMAADAKRAIDEIDKKLFLK